MFNPSSQDNPIKLSLSKDNLIMNYNKTSTVIFLDDLMHFTFF